MTHFLLIDDDETFLRVMQRALERREFQVSTARDAAQLAAVTGTIDKAIVDLNLGGESGLNLIVPIKQRWPQADLLILTGYSSIATAVEAVKRGATDYLCKPAGVDELLTALGMQPGNQTVDVPDTPPSIDRLEWEHIQRVLQDNNANISATARALGMHRRTLQRKLRKRPTRS